MKKISIVICLSFIVLASCIKSSDTKPDCPPVTVTAPSAEVDSLRAYLTANNITATEDSRGFFYTINAAGDTTKPTACDYVTVTYRGVLTNGTQFDAASNANFPLSRVITGWQEGIPLIGTGGSITLYIPPSLGYGSIDYGTIPANSTLIFNVSLTGIN